MRYRVEISFKDEVGVCQIRGVISVEVGAESPKEAEEKALQIAEVNVPWKELGLVFTTRLP